MEGQQFAAFISHSSRDLQKATELCHLLEQRGLSCWIAPRNVIGGHEYADEIVRGIAESASMVVLVSSHSNLSNHVLREVEQAVRMGKPIFPILLEKVQLRRALDYYLAPIHWIEATAGLGDPMAGTLASAIQGDSAWKTAAVAPSLGRRIRYGRNAFVAALTGGFIVVAAILTAALTVWSVWSRTRQNKADKDPTSIGWVRFAQSTAPFGGPDIRSNVQALIFLADPSVRSSDITFSVVGLDIPGHENGRFSIVPSVGSPRSLDFRINGFEPTVVTCLALPHPRLGSRYRVTQVFKAHEAQSGSARIIEFTPAGDDSVRNDDGSRCGAHN
jgi:hypothetical protein